MKAVVCKRYGPPDVLQLQELEKPVPKDNEVLIRVHAATVMAGDCELRSLRLSPLWQLFLRLGFGFRRPRKKILGQELSGEVESVGKDVTQFKKGDQVFANTGLHLGAYAEYTCLPENGWLATKPDGMSYEEAATVPSAGLYVLPLLRKANLRRGHKVLIIGAGGTMGTFAVQFAKSFGAEVTAVDSAGKLEMLRSIGAAEVIDYTSDDYAKGSETYDVIADMVGKSSFSGCLRLLNENGIYLLGNPGLSQLIRRLLTSRRTGKKVAVGRATYKIEDLILLKELIETGKIRPVIDRHYPLEQIAEAHRYVDTGQKKGNVVVTIANNETT